MNLIIRNWHTQNEIELANIENYIPSQASDKIYARLIICKFIDFLPARHHVCIERIYILRFSTD